MSDSSKAIAVGASLVAGFLVLKKALAKPKPAPGPRGTITLRIIDAITGKPVPYASHRTSGFGAIIGPGSSPTFSVIEGREYFLIGSLQNNSRRTVGTVTTDEPAVFNVTITGIAGTTGFAVYGPADVDLDALVQAVWSTSGVPPAVTGDIPFTIPDRVGNTTGSIVATAIAPDGSIAARTTVNLTIQAIAIFYDATITLGVR